MENSKQAPVALITGASQRIGRAITQSLHEHNYRVVIHCHKNVQHAQMLANNLNLIRENTATTYQANLGNPDEIEALAQHALQKWNRLDVVINNASVFEPDMAEYGSDVQSSEILKQWQETNDLNVRGAFLLSRILNPAIQKTAGSIINLVDIYGKHPLKSHSIYSISKAGIAMLTKSLALELAPKVRVNGISPGAILWPTNETGSEEIGQHHQKILNKVPLARLGSSEAIVETVHYLLRCDYITGQIIKVDGGRSIAI